MKRSCIFILLSVLTNTHTVLQTRLPNNFYLLDQTGQNNLFDASKQPAAFYIFVNTSSSLPLQNNAVYQTLLSFATTTPVIPAGFCRDLNGSGPIISLYFNWQDKVGFKNIRDFGTIFAKGIHELSTGYNAPCIIVSLGRAGLLVNAASSLWNSPSPISPLPIVIQIGTPLPQPNSQFQDLMPNATTIQRLFHYYSQQPFITDQPTLNPPYGFDYDQPIQGLDIYKIIVLLHNQQPLQTALCMPLLTQSIITYSANAQTNYIKNRNLFLEISKNRKVETNGMIAIANPIKSTLINAQAQQEFILSNSVISAFTTAWGRPPAITVGQGEYLRNTFRYQGTSQQNTTAQTTPTPSATPSTSGPTNVTIPSTQNSAATNVAPQQTTSTPNTVSA